MAFYCSTKGQFEGTKGQLLCSLDPIVKIIRIFFCEFYTVLPISKSIEKHLKNHIKIISCLPGQDFIFHFQKLRRIMGHENSLFYAL
jgi:hypothetical protein